MSGVMPPRLRAQATEAPPVSQARFDIPKAPPAWSVPAPVSQVKPHAEHVLSPEVSRQLAALKREPRAYHQSDAMYVKKHVFAANGILNSRRLSAQLVKALQKQAVIVGDPNMVSDWNPIGGHHDADTWAVDLTGDQRSRRFVCLTNVHEVMNKLRVGFFGANKLSPAEECGVVTFLAEFKRVSENRYTCARVWERQQQAFYRNVLEPYTRELDIVVNRIWNDPQALQKRRELDLLCYLSRPLTLG